jgi:hypothetical protein
MSKSCKTTQEVNCHYQGFLGLVGTVLQERYLVCAPLGKGSYGSIYTCKDLLAGKELLVVKFQE